MRGRLGLRLGNTYSVWQHATLEPFVIGSVWSNLSDDENQARLTSTGTSFVFTDDLTDVWGEISGGVNLFSPNGRTSAFAKIDVSFGDDLTGVGGKLGIRTKW